MEPSDAGLRHQPFRTHGPPLTVFPYSAQHAALQFLADTYADDRGLGLFQGPPLSGKTTILHAYTAGLPDDLAWAIVDGAGIEPDAFLSEILRQFGYEFQFHTTNELVNMLKVVILQQAAAGQPPLLVIENTQGMTPEALGLLCELVALEVQDKSALKLVLACDRSMAVMIRAPVMKCVADRQTGSFFLDPMTVDETGDYLYAKLHAGGCAKPERVFPPDVCGELHDASAGWPGIVDRLALSALTNAQSLPVTRELVERPSVPEELPTLLFRIDQEVEAVTLTEAPRLIISYEGDTIEEVRMTSRRLLIGRSEHNDLRIASRFISRHHALFVRHGNATFLMDLNSTNGTFVNSRRISNLMMKDDDVVMIGNHRIKFVDSTATERRPMDDPTLTETLVMKSLEDVRRLLARETTRAVDSGDDDDQAAADR